MTDGQEDVNFNGRVDAGESNPDESVGQQPKAIPWIPLLLLED